MELVDKLLLVDDHSPLHEGVDCCSHNEVRVDVWLHQVGQEPHLGFCLVYWIDCNEFSILDKYVLFYTLLYVLL